jgi:hypothetical protein
VQYYFSKRGEFRTPNISSTNLALNYRYPISRFELFANGEVLNVFNKHGAIVVGTTVLTRAAFNPFTTTPIECKQGDTAAQCADPLRYPGGLPNWQKSATFGQPTSATASTPESTTTNFQVARTYRFSVGARF